MRVYWCACCVCVEILFEFGKEIALFGMFGRMFRVFDLDDIFQQTFHLLFGSIWNVGGVLSYHGVHVLLDVYYNAITKFNDVVVVYYINSEFDIPKCVVEFNDELHVVRVLEFRSGDHFGFVGDVFNWRRHEGPAIAAHWN